MSEANNKRIAKNTMYLYVRMILTMIVSLFTVRVVLKVLGVEDYGVYASIAGVVSSLSFISSVLANASQRFFSYEIGKNNNDSLQEVFGTIFFTYVAVSLLVLTIAESVGLWFVVNKMNFPFDAISSVRWVYQFSLASFVITLLANPFQAIIISFERMKLFACMSILEVFLKLGVAFALFYSHLDKLKLYACLLFVSSFVVQIVYVIVGGKIFFTKKVTLMWSRSRFKDIFSYTSWTLFGTVAGVCNSQGLNILLNVFYGPIANAAYAISSQVSSAVNSLASNFFIAVRPPLIKSYAQNDTHSTNALFYFSSKIIFVLLFIITVPIFFKTDVILELWLGNVSPYMVSFVRCILIYAIVMRLSDPITVILQAANKVKVYHGIVDTFTMLSLPISYLFLLKGYPAEIVFVVSICIFVIAHVIRLLIMKKYFQFSLVEYMFRLGIPISMSIIMTVVCCYAVDVVMPSNKLASIVSMGLACLISIIISWFIIFRKNERKRVVNIVLKR